MSNKTNKIKKNRKTYSKKRRTVKKTGGDWFSLFSDNSNDTETIYDKYIAKYKKQISDLNVAIKALQDKIAKMEIAKQSDATIKNENKKLAELTRQKNDALKSATSNGNWFSSFFK